MLQRDSAVTLQAQIRQAVIQAIHERRLLPDAAMPSTRTLADALEVSRNTVVQAYERLVDDGYLSSEASSGHRIQTRAYADAALPATAPSTHVPNDAAAGATPDWAARIGPGTSAFRYVRKPIDWQRYPYPFVFGQFDPTLFPAADWREASALAMRRMAVRDWAGDRIDRDDPALVKQIQSRVLTRRGIWAAADEILITLGSQQAMFLISTLIRPHARCVGLEEPGYPDLHNLFRLSGTPTRSLELGPDGLRADDQLEGCDYLFVAPSHQNPTCRTMPLAARRALLDAAIARDFVIVEDDYDSELSFDNSATPSIKSLDGSGRVLYVGSLSKTIAAGLRMGFVVAPAPVIRELRALRRLMLRHPPANNQRAVALFFSLGHYDALLPRLTEAYRARAQVLCAALEEHLPQLKFAAPRGGSAVWLTAPEGTDMAGIRDRALVHGVVFDAGIDFFAAESAPRHHFRLGYSSIALEQIVPGVHALAACMREAGAA